MNPTVPARHAHRCPLPAGASQRSARRPRAWKRTPSTTTGLAIGDGTHTVTGKDATFTTHESPARVNDQPAYASNISQFTATLNGMVDPKGIPTSYHFVYGTSTAYGSSAPSPDRYVPINEADDTVSQVLGELQPGITYHFALVANNPNGQSMGPDETFTTPSVPAPAVTTTGASEVTVGAATLSGTIDPQGFQTSYYFEYGPTSAYGSRWPGIPVALGGLGGAQPVVSYVQNLFPGTLYHYRLVATNPGGTSYGADETFQTPEYPASIVQTTPVLGVPIGINPETKPSSKAPKHKTKKKKTRKKAKRRKKK